MPQSISKPAAEAADAEGVPSRLLAVALSGADFGGPGDADGGGEGAPADTARSAAALLADLVSSTALLAAQEGRPAQVRVSDLHLFWDLGGAGAQLPGGCVRTPLLLLAPWPARAAAATRWAAALSLWLLCVAPLARWSLQAADALTLIEPLVVPLVGQLANDVVSCRAFCSTLYQLSVIRWEEPVDAEFDPDDPAMMMMMMMGQGGAGVSDRRAAPPEEEQYKLSSVLVTVVGKAAQGLTALLAGGYVPRPRPQAGIHVRGHRGR